MSPSRAPSPAEGTPAAAPQGAAVFSPPRGPSPLGLGGAAMHPWRVWLAAAPTADTPRPLQPGGKEGRCSSASGPQQPQQQPGCRGDARGGHQSPEGRHPPSGATAQWAYHHTAGSVPDPGGAVPGVAGAPDKGFQAAAARDQCRGGPPL